MSIRSMKLDDVLDVVDIHLVAFQGFFLSLLGKEFLRQLYTGIIEDDSGISLVYDLNGVVGFVAGSTQPNSLFKRLLKKRWLEFGLSSVKPVLRNPKIIPRLLRAFKAPSEYDRGNNVGILMSIAVNPLHQNKGIGKKLVLSFLEEARKRSLSAVYLTTDKFGNDSVNKFYEKMGFKVVRVITTPEGRKMNEYQIKL